MGQPVAGSRGERGLRVRGLRDRGRQRIHVYNGASLSGTLGTKESVLIIIIISEVFWV